MSTEFEDVAPKIADLPQCFWHSHCPPSTQSNAVETEKASHLTASLILLLHTSRGRIRVDVTRTTNPTHMIVATAIRFDCSLAVRLRSWATTALSLC